MIKYYVSENSQVTELSRPQKNCWIDMIEPSEKEIADISALSGVEVDVISAALDEEERSRVEIEDNYSMVIVDIPTTEDHHGKPSYITMPLSIIITDNYFITVCTEETPLLSHFYNGKIKNFYTKMKTRFILQILYRNASLFLHYLRSIDKKSEIVEKRLHFSTQNKELIQLLELEKSLVYFTTSLRGNQVVLDKLIKLPIVKHYPEDEDLLEDTIIENNQAIEMAGIYSGILSGMMDAFASIISNNLNQVMKFLAVVTIIMSIPTMIFSAFGMNLNIPFADNPFMLLYVIGGAILLGAIIAFVFFKTKIFK